MRTSFTHVTNRTIGCFVAFLLLVWPHTASAITYMSIETVPNRDVVGGEDVVVTIRSIGYANLERWSQRLLDQCRVVDSVIDTLTANAAISSVTSTNTRVVVAAGGFEGGTNPSFVLTVKDSGPGSVTEADVDVLGNALGYVLSQGSTAHFSPDNFKAYAFPLDYILVTFSGTVERRRSASLLRAPGHDRRGAVQRPVRRVHADRSPRLADEQLDAVPPAGREQTPVHLGSLGGGGGRSTARVVFTAQEQRRADDGASGRRVSRKRLARVSRRGSVSGERRQLRSATERACGPPGTTSDCRYELAGGDRGRRRRGVPRAVHVSELTAMASRAFVRASPIWAQGCGFQFRIIVIGNVTTSSISVFIRNRWPSDETAY